MNGNYGMHGEVRNVALRFKFKMRIVLRYTLLILARSPPVSWKICKSNSV